MLEVQISHRVIQRHASNCDQLQLDIILISIEISLPWMVSFNSCICSMALGIVCCKKVHQCSSPKIKVDRLHRVE